MSDKYAVNTKVEWEWGRGTGQGKVREVSTEHVSRTIKGSEVTRNATSDNPAYLIEQDDGDRVLKSHFRAAQSGLIGTLGRSQVCVSGAEALQGAWRKASIVSRGCGSSCDGAVRWRS